MQRLWGVKYKSLTRIHFQFLTTMSNTSKKIDMLLRIESDHDGHDEGQL